VGGPRHGRRTPASSSGNCGGQPYVLSSWLSLSAHALMGMPVQWKPCGKSTRLPHSRWYADANSSCAPRQRARRPALGRALQRRRRQRSSAPWTARRRGRGAAGRSCTGTGNCRKICRCTPPLQHSQNVSLSAQRWTAGMLSAAVTLLDWWVARLPRAHRPRISSPQPSAAVYLLVWTAAGPSVQSFEAPATQLTGEHGAFRARCRTYKKKYIDVSWYQLTSSFAMMVC
jgi:hypothetical protein